MVDSQINRPTIKFRYTFERLLKQDYRVSVMPYQFVNDDFILLREGEVIEYYVFVLADMAVLAEVYSVIVQQHEAHAMFKHYPFTLIDDYTKLRLTFTFDAGIQDIQVTIRDAY